MAKKQKVAKGKKAPVSPKSSKAPRTKASPVKKAAAKKAGPARKAVSKPAKKAARAVKKTTAKKASAPAKAHKLSADDKKKFRALLIRIRAHITGQINFLSTDNLSRTKDDTDLDFRSEEQGTDNFDRDLALSRVSMEQNVLFEIDEALNRIETGAYGICGDCGELIERGRLAVLPHSRLCVSCQSQAETGTKRTRTGDGTVFRNSDSPVSESETEEED